MDLTHQEFVEQLNAFETVGDEELKARYADILAHTETHFRREDEWMQRLDYPHRAEHMAEHEKVLKVMQAVWRSMEDGDARFGRVLIRELATWFGEHALTMDARLAEFLRAQGHVPGLQGIAPGAQDANGGR